MENLLNGLLIFAFIFSILIILKDLYNVIKVLSLREGRMELTDTKLIVLGSAISYFITMLIMWS